MSTNDRLTDAELAALRPRSLTPPPNPYTDGTLDQENYDD